MTATPPLLASMDIGQSLHQLVERLYPICRSITGNGVRETLKIIQELIPLEIHEVASGTQVFDWQVPPEWNIRDAYIKNSYGERIVDFQELNLHVLNYSTAIHGYFSKEELLPHLYSLPDQPDLVPYRTSFYKRNWGFCISHNQLEALEDDLYEVCIDSSLEPGHLTYGEFYLPGESEEEVLISAHTCHPSLANDNLSGITVAAHLAAYLQNQDRKLSYRFIFIPATIGAITWLAMNTAKLPNIKSGIVASLLGDGGAFTYKKSRAGDAIMDQAVEQALVDLKKTHSIVDFFPYGYDERQFCSPGINLGVGNLSRTPFAQFPEYHTSADTPDFVRPEFLKESLDVYKEVMFILDKNETCINLSPNCEPQLGRRGLYDGIGGLFDEEKLQLATLWILNLADGKHSLLDIAKRSGVNFSAVAKMAQKLKTFNLLETVS